MKIYETRIIKQETEAYEPVTKLAPISVIVNGVQVEFETALILDRPMILFNTPLQEGDKLTIMFESDLPKVFTKSKYGTGAVYKLYSDEVKLKFNSNYKFVIEANETFTSEFTSKYDPFFSTVKIIRRDTGDLLNDVSEEVIASIIYDNSLYVVDKLINIDDGDELEDMYDLDDFEYRVPPYVTNYVRYKTSLDLCYSIYLTKTGKLGAFKKKIGDLDISSEIKLPALTEMMSRFKELIKPYEDLLNNGDSGLTAGFVKANSTSYPISSRGIF